MEKYLIFVDGFMAYSFLGGTSYVLITCVKDALVRLMTDVFGYVSRYFIIGVGDSIVDQMLLDHRSRGIMVSDLNEVLKGIK